MDPVRLPPEPADPLQPWNPPVVDDLSAARRSWAAPDAQRRRARPWVSIVLLLATVLTTTAAGVLHYAAFAADFGTHLPPFDRWLILHGFWYSGTILAILGCHELGHYFACRYYNVAASRPYFLPVPFLLTGTLGAFIRIRQPIPGKRELFDIGVAGPIAGFVVATPLLFIGMYLSRVEAIPNDFHDQLFWLGEPLLFKLAAWLTFGHVAEGFTVTTSPTSPRSTSSPA